jgi:isoleucyl-tRNA synthetase
LDYRTLVQGVLEGSRRDKVIGSSLEAAVELRANKEDYAFLISYERDLAMVFIVSQVKVMATGEPKSYLAIAASKSSFGKCERCWNYREAVGSHAAHPALCDRCVEAVQ